MTLSVRESIIATLKDNPGDWFSAREIFDAIDQLDAVSPHRVGNILRTMHQEGLVARQAKGNSNLWCVSPHEPEVPSNKDQPKPVTTTQPRPLPRLPKDYTARIKVGIYADSDNAFLTIIAEDEGSGAFWTLETKGGRLSFDQGEADWLPQLGDGLAQLLDTINGRPLTQPEI